MDGSIRTLAEMHRALQQGETTPSILAKEALERAKAAQPTLNAFVTLLDQAVEQASKLDGKPVEGPLFGIPYAAKDNFSTRGILTTGSSHMLENYVPVFDATVIERLKKAGAILIGKTVLDELGMGGTGMSGHTGWVHNPWSCERKHMAGGSSAGSAAAVSAGIVPFALGSDTGDSVRKPAAYCGVVGFKPTWGRISRYGLFSFCVSLDHVGMFTRSVEDAAYVMETLSGGDPLDMTCSTKPVPAYATALSPQLQGVRIAVLQPVVDSVPNPEVKANFEKVLAKATAAGAIVTKIPFDTALLKALYPVYMVLSCAEATSNNANLDGIRFGPRGAGTTFEEMMITTRTKGFGELIKRRFVLGSYCLARENKEELFLRAQKIRQRVVRHLKQVYENFDIILSPATGDVAPEFTKNCQEEKLSDHYLIAENHLVLANFSGYPSLTLPSGLVSGLPVGVNLMAFANEDQRVLDVALGLEALLGFRNRTPNGGDCR